MDEHQVVVSVNSSVPTISEPSVSVTLYQGLPKSDKMDSVVQKAVEMGVTRIVPVLTQRCVSRPDQKSAQKSRTLAKRFPLKQQSNAVVVYYPL